MTKQETCSTCTHGVTHVFASGETSDKIRCELKRRGKYLGIIKEKTDTCEAWEGDGKR